MVHNSLPRHHYLHLLIAQVQEVVSGEWDVCGRQHDSDHWLAPSHDLVMMGGVMHQISQVVRTKAMLTQAIHLVGAE